MYPLSLNPDTLKPPAVTKLTMEQMCIVVKPKITYVNESYLIYYDRQVIHHVCSHYLPSFPRPTDCKYLIVMRIDGVNIAALCFGFYLEFLESHNFFVQPNGANFDHVHAMVSVMHQVHQLQLPQETSDSLKTFVDERIAHVFLSALPSQHKTWTDIECLPIHIQYPYNQEMDWIQNYIFDHRSPFYIDKFHAGNYLITIKENNWNRDYLQLFMFMFMSTMNVMSTDVRPGATLIHYWNTVIDLMIKQYNAPENEETHKFLKACKVKRMDVSNISWVKQIAVKYNAVEAVKQTLSAD